MNACRFVRPTSIGLPPAGGPSAWLSAGEPMLWLVAALPPKRPIRRAERASLHATRSWPPAPSRDCHPTASTGQPRRWGAALGARASVAPGREGGFSDGLTAPYPPPSDHQSAFARAGNWRLLIPFSSMLGRLRPLARRGAPVAPLPMTAGLSFLAVGEPRLGGRGRGRNFLWATIGWGHRRALPGTLTGWPYPRVPQTNHLLTENRSTL